MGGSAQNTLLTCRELGGRYETVLVHGLARESGMTAAEAQAVAARTQAAAERGVRFIRMSVAGAADQPSAGHHGLRRPAVAYSQAETGHRPHPYIEGRDPRAAGRPPGRGPPHRAYAPRACILRALRPAGLRPSFYRWSARFARFTEKIVALTPSERQDYIDLNVGRPEDILTIHSGVDLDHFDVGTPDRLPRKPPSGSIRPPPGRLRRLAFAHQRPHAPLERHGVGLGKPPRCDPGVCRQGGRWRRS